MTTVGVSEAGVGRSDDFRAELRSWFSLNADTLPRGNSPEAALELQRRLDSSGYSGLTWPVEYGGRGLSAIEQRIFDEVAQDYELPFEPLGISLGMLGPILIDLGTEEQKQAVLPGLIKGDFIGCQLFSEPDAGSDVASLRTRAVRDQDGWVINGQKVWTTFAHAASFGILLARTDPDAPKHQGITMFLVDMTAPGVTVRPLTDMTGAQKFNEVYFDDVRVPTGSVVGEVNQGWQATIRLLRHERMVASQRIKRKDDPSSVRALAPRLIASGRQNDQRARDALAEIYIGERVHELYSARLAQEVRSGKDPGPRGSVGKLAAGRHHRVVPDLITTMFGEETAAYPVVDPQSALELVITGAPRYRIAGGTDQIQRTIVAERILGLPKEPS